MKKATILTVMIIASKLCFSQVFAGLNLGSSHAGLSAGIESNNVAVTVAMNHSYYKTEVPSYYSMQVGYIYHFTEENSFVIGGHAGYAYAKSKVIKDNVVDKELNEMKGVYTLEAGKNMHTGRLSLTCSYLSSRLYYGVSIKCFF